VILSYFYKVFIKIQYPQEKKLPISIIFILYIMPNTAKKNNILIVLLLHLSCIVHAQQISGNVFIDRDGLTNADINTSFGANNPTVSGSLLFVNLLNNFGQAVASTAVSSTGGFLFNNIPNGDYVTQLTINASNGSYATPSVAPNTTLASGWVNTGEFIGNTAGNDGNTDGKSVSITIISSSVINNVNFGIERLPETSNATAYIGNGGGNSSLTVAVLYDLNSSPFAGSDAEDQPLSSSLLGKSIKVTSALSTLISSETAILFYNGTAVNVGQIIDSYNPALLKVSFSNTQNCSECFSGYDFKFLYSYIDAAGFADPTPASYIIRYPIAAPVPFVITDFFVNKRNCTATLHWKTATEFDTQKFELEYNTVANSTFKLLGSISAAGISTIEKKYQFSHTLESDVVYSFRIKMTKRSGMISYSNVQTISCLENELKIEIAPNPALNVIRVNGLLKGKNTISIYSKDGSLVTSKIANNNKDIDISHLPSGVYILKILNENGTSTVERLVKY
jgi:Secretion system C-terminal sorting domain